MLFLDSIRDDDSAKRHFESQYVFWDRRLGPEADRVRNLLNDLTELYPANERSELVRRFRSGDDTHFRSAIFELLIYGFLTRVGCHVTINPNLPNSSAKRPDFLVRTPSNEECYLELRCASEYNDETVMGIALKSQVMEYLNDRSHPNFVLIVASDGSPATQPSAKALYNEISCWLDKLNPDEVQLSYVRTKELPTYLRKHDGWTLRLESWPLPEGRRGNGETLIAIRSNYKATIVNRWEPIVRAIQRKKRRYGELDLPFAIAINLDSNHLDRIDEMQALFGEERWSYSIDDPTAEPRFDRAPNGAWYGKRGARATNVSGVWLFDDLTLAKVATCTHTIYFHPQATYPLPCFFREVPHAEPQDGRMVLCKGIHCFRQAFGLDERWPYSAPGDMT